MTVMPSTTAGRGSQRSLLATDLDALRELAGRLNGRPVPGVRMTERQFVAWGAPTAVPAEWVDGEVILMPTPSLLHQELAGWLYRLLFAFAERHDAGIAYLPLTVFSVPACPS